MRESLAQWKLSASVFVDLHFGLSVGEEVAEQLRICNREAFVDYSDKQAFPPDTVKCLGVVKKGQEGFLRLAGLMTVTDRLREFTLN